MFPDFEFRTSLGTSILLLEHEDDILLSLPQCGDWLFFSFLSKNVQNRHKRTLDVTFLDCLVLTLYDVISDLLPEWDNSSDIKFGGYSCVKSEKRKCFTFHFMNLTVEPVKPQPTNREAKGM